eukprot:8782705-Pyramimonas_sp.AAC.1
MGRGGRGQGKGCRAPSRPTCPNATSGRLSQVSGAAWARATAGARLGAASATPRSTSRATAPGAAANG